MDLALGLCPSFLDCRSWSRDEGPLALLGREHGMVVLSHEVGLVARSQTGMGRCSCYSLMGQLAVDAHDCQRCLDSDRKVHQRKANE